MNTIAQEKQKRKSDRAVRARSVFLMVAIFACFCLLIGNFFYIQVFQNEMWKKRAVSQQLADIEVPASRGQIYDANMAVLALTREVYTVIMDPSNIKDAATRDMIVEEVSARLDVDKEKLREQASDSSSQYKVVKTKLNKADGDAFKAWAKEQKLTTVFYLVDDFKREYPLKNLLSCTLGFVGTDNQAREGLELQYDSILSGTPGRMVVTQNENGDRLPNSLNYEYVVDAVDGHSLVLTVDQYVQQVAEKYLQETVDQYAATNRGCAIVMDVQTGAILALAVKGDYDPNNYLAIGNPTLAEQIAQLSGDEYNEALVKARLEQYRNKSLDFYEPGSVFKTFTAAMGLEEGLVKEEDTFYCSPFTIADRTMECWADHSHGQQTFTQAIANSCNPVFMTVSQKIGTRLFSKYYTGFGFTEKTGVDMLGEPSVSANLYHTADRITPVDVATSSIGQTFKATPLQMVTALSAIANGGNLMQPYIVDKIIDSNGNVISATQPTARRQVVSADTSKRVCAMLENAVSGGAIKNAYITGYRVAGKTGTAEKTETRGEDDDDDAIVEVVASFGGFAPADDPQVAVLVMIDEPQKLKSGGGVAAPAARKILEDILPYLGVEPNYTEAEIAGLDRNTPNVLGSTPTSAATVLKASSLSYRVVGKGDTVTMQVPPAGSTLPKDGTVWLYTDASETEKTAVPDFNGLTLSQVKQLAKQKGLNVLMSGVNSTGGVPKASRQSAEAGTEVAKGTVIKVEFTYADNIY